MSRRTVPFHDIKNNVHFFVSLFLSKDTNVKISTTEMMKYILLYISSNKDILRVENDARFIKIINELKILFDNCSMIAKIRGKDIIVPEVMHYNQIYSYLEFCFVKDTDFYILNEQDLEYKKNFFDTISDELYSVVLSPNRISSWVHLGLDIDLTPFSHNFV